MIPYGIIGGSAGSFIADVHIRGLEATRKAALVAGCFSRYEEKSKESAIAYGVSQERTYASFEEMARKESVRADGIRFVVIAAPNHVHYTCAKTFLNYGISVACDKPVALTHGEALDLQELASTKGLKFCVTYTFAGLPSLHHMQRIVRDGTLGTLRMIVGENVQDWMVGDLASGDIASWRTNPQIAGKSNCLSDIGTHVEFASHFVTGLDIAQVCCVLSRYDEPLDSNATIMVEYQNGASGMFWATQVAYGNENGMRLRVYGSNGSIEWANERPEEFFLTLQGQPTMRIVKSKNYNNSQYFYKSRLPAGHAEGWYYAFCNIYEGFLSALAGNEQAYYPSIADGVRGMQFVDACFSSDTASHAWTPL